MITPVSQNSFGGAIVETARIVNVNVQDWTVDVATEHGDKKHFDIQVSTPYLHFFNGEGIYCMPEVGALCWICKPSEGRMSTPFVLGFQAPHDQQFDNFKAGRQSLNPGDIMMRTRDENFLILRRGGVVQIGATPVTQRMFIPVGNIIRDFCESYQLFTFGGELTWNTARKENASDGSALTTFSLKAKEKADEPKHIAELTIGSHGEGDPTTLSIVVRESGAKRALTKVNVVFTKEGDVSWEVTRDYSMRVDRNYSLEVGGDHSTQVSGATSLASTGKYSVETQAKAIMRALSDMELQSTAGKVKIDGIPVAGIQLGSARLTPAVRFQELNLLIQAILDLIASLQCPSAVAAAAIAASTGVPATPILASMLSVTPVIGAQGAPLLKALIPPVASIKVVTE